MLKETVTYEDNSDAALIARAIPGTGWLRTYVDWCHPCSEAPKLFHLVCGLSCLSAAVGRRAFVQMGAAKLYGNTFVALIGSQGIVRKSTSLNMAYGIIEKTFADILYEGDATEEALQQKVLKDTPERMLFFDELSTALGGPEYKKHLGRFMAKLFDCPSKVSWARIGKGDGTVENPTVSILGASTLSWLRDSTSQADVGGGILSRFIWAVAAHEGRLLPLPEEPCPKVCVKLISELRDLYDNLTGAPRRLSMTATEAVHNQFYMTNMKRAQAECEEGMGGFIARLTSAHAPKIAMLMTLAENPGATEVSPTVYEQNVIPLITLLERGMRTVVDNMTSTAAGRLQEEVERRITQAGEAGLSQRDLIRGTHAQLKELEPILATLLVCDIVKQVKDGRKIRYYIA